MLTGKEQEAMRLWRKANELYPNRDLLHFYPILHLLIDEQYDEAEEEFSKLGPQALNQPLIKFLRGYLLGRKGKTEEALKIAREIEEACNKGYASEDHVAFVYAGLGNIEEFFRWMERGVENHHVEPLVLRHHSKLEPKEVNFDPARWEKLILKAGFL